VGTTFLGLRPEKKKSLKQDAGKSIYYYCSTAIATEVGLTSVASGSADEAPIEPDKTRQGLTRAFGSALSRTSDESIHIHCLDVWSCGGDLACGDGEGWYR
jgi:hypothetical protein